MLPFLLLALLHLYIGARIAPSLPGNWPPALFSAALVLSFALIPVAFFGRRLRDRAAADRWSWAGMLALGSFAILLPLTLLRDAVLLLAAPIGMFVALPALAEPSAWAVPPLAALLLLWGLANARRPAQVRTVEVPIAGLPATLQGFTIAQISDVHVGPTVKAGYVQAIVERVNALQADVVAITGDLVDGRVADLQQDVAPLAGLQARQGRYFVTGNHEYYSGAREWTAHLRTLGLQVLDNRHVVLGQGEARLVLAGVTDVSAHHFIPEQRSDPQRAIAGAPADAAVRVLLAHQPRSAEAAATAGFDLQLSGHTHGGQIWPFNFFVPLQQPFVAGLHRLRQLWIYTSRGTGYWGPPLRLGAPSEITRLRLVAA
ncbi:metallophosphoesterase [Aquabacterium sp.]|uniref:metallophosphoesterase n=1 Tax=Aquabacterium sp. TaxID=1872578 RepID=UPI00378371D7